VNKITCTCGTKVGPANRRYSLNGLMKCHQDSTWHIIAKEARMLRGMGLSYGEVARQLTVKISKQEVHRRLKAEGL
jgi:hypothetical protein